MSDCSKIRYASRRTAIAAKRALARKNKKREVPARRARTSVAGAGAGISRPTLETRSHPGRSHGPSTERGVVGAPDPYPAQSSGP